MSTEIRTCFVVRSRKSGTTEWLLSYDGTRGLVVNVEVSCGWKYSKIFLVFKSTAITPLANKVSGTRSDCLESRCNRADLSRVPLCQLKVRHQQTDGHWTDMSSYKHIKRRVVASKNAGAFS